jgi:hypothetical protein
VPGISEQQPAPTDMAKSQKIWYAMVMAKRKDTSGKPGKTGFVVGAAGFAKISAVEGIRLSPAMKKRAAEAGSKGLTAEEARRVIIRTYRKG